GQVRADANVVGIASAIVVLKGARPAEGRQREAILQSEDRTDLPAADHSVGGPAGGAGESLAFAERQLIEQRIRPAAREVEGRTRTLRLEIVIVRRREQLADAARGADAAGVVDRLAKAERAELSLTKADFFPGKFDPIG